MRMGSVVEPGPATKNEITKSSIDKVKASSAPEAIPGARLFHPEIVRNEIEAHGQSRLLHTRLVRNDAVLGLSAQ